MARINLVLKTSKVLSDGSSPILLMVAFNGKSTRSTGYSCTPKYWDKRGQCVKKGYSNYVMINHAIQQMKNEAIERMNEYERLGEVHQWLWQHY